MIFYLVTIHNNNYAQVSLVHEYVSLILLTGFIAAGEADTSRCGAI